MLHVRIGPAQRPRLTLFRFWKFIAAALIVASFSFFLIQKYSDVFGASDKTAAQGHRVEHERAAQCPTVVCPESHFSFFIQSGAANAVPPKICFRNELVLGAAKQNAGRGINVVIVNGETGELINTGHYDMWDGDADVVPLINFLKAIDSGSIVLMASYDEPATQLNEEARRLILDLGSSLIKSVAFRDNWIFVGGKGAKVQNTFEKHLKNDQKNDKYDGWPELIDISGCIPKYTP